MGYLTKLGPMSDIHDPSILITRAQVGSPLATSAPGLGLTAATSAPGQHAWWALCCNVLYCVATLRVGACQAELAGAVAAECGAGPEAEHTNEERAEKER